MKLKFFGLVLCFFAAVFTAAVRAEDPAAVKARMAQRTPQVDAAKGRGAAGENNRGFLEARDGATADDNSLIAAENKDREAAYAAIAQAQNTTADQVGKARAAQLAARSAPGVWIQAPDGSWKKK
jgi:uncharacterized protein